MRHGQRFLSLFLVFVLIAETAFLPATTAQEEEAARALVRGAPERAGPVHEPEREDRGPPVRPLKGDASRDGCGCEETRHVRVRPGAARRDGGRSRAHRQALREEQRFLPGGPARLAQIPNAKRQRMFPLREYMRVNGRGWQRLNQLPGQ